MERDLPPGFLESIAIDRAGTKTNWCVITGAPSSGKTSVIQFLANHGYVTAPEVARELIALGLLHGHTLQEIRADALSLQRDILKMTLARELTLDPAQLLFMDRGLPDSITYFRLGGFESLEAKAAAQIFRYRAVFIFNRLPIVKDDVRTEDEVLTQKIDTMLDQDYQAAGYMPVRVPVMPIHQRAQFILDHLGLMQKDRPLK